MRLPRPDGAVEELPGQQGPTAFQLSKHVPAETRVLAQELCPTALPGVLAGSSASHAGQDQREVLDRPNEGAPFEELALSPEQPIELRHVVGAEAAPEDELLRRGDGCDRVDLQEAKTAHGVEDAG